MNTEVFISHHTSSSLHIVEAIANSLESKGVPCWYAPRDTEGDYAGSIMDAIAACKVFIVVLNRSASESVHVLNELNAVTERIVNKESVSILPFHVADEEISPRAKYYLGRLHWMEAMTPPMYKRVEELVDKVLTLLDSQGVSPVHTANKGQNNAKTYTLVSRPPEVRETFMGRDHLIHEIGEVFASGCHELFLEGIAGIGKSELAKQYYFHSRQSYDQVLFLTYQTNLCDLVCDDNVLNIQGVDRSPEESDRDYFLRKIRIFHTIAGARTLVIVDNFDVSEDPDLQEFLAGSCDVLFTSRYAHPGHKHLQVESIRDETMLQAIFEAHYGDTINDEELPLLHKIFELVEYHTYALELIAKQMAASFLSLDEMYEILKQGQLNTISGECVDGRTDTKTAFGHISALFNVFRLGDEEKDLLRKLSLIGHEGISASWFKKWAGLTSFETVNKLIKNSWIRKSHTRKLSLHPLVTDVIHAELDPGPDNCHDFLAQMSAYCYSAWYHTYEENMDLLPCVQAVLHYAEPYQGQDFDLLEPCIVFLWIQGCYRESIACGHKLYDACLRDLGELDARTAYAAKTLGGCYYNCRRAEESIPWYRKGLELILKQDTPYLLDLGMFHEKYARCCSWAWNRDFDKAEALFRKALDYRQEALRQTEMGHTIPTISPYGKSDAAEIKSQYSVTLMEMGRMYQLKGDYDQALVYNGKYRECTQQLNGYHEDNNVYCDMDHGICLLHLAQIRQKEGRSEEALQALQEAVKSLTAALETNLSRHGAFAMDTIDTQEYLADAYALLGQYGEASNGYMAVIHMLEQALGEDHPRIAHVKRKMDFSLPFPDYDPPLFL